MKRSFSLQSDRPLLLITAGTALIAATYGLVRLTYGLFLPDVQAELALSASTAGLISSGASAAYCIAAIAGFLFAARAPHLFAGLATVTAAGGAIGMSLAGTGALFATAAILASSGAGFASPALVELLQRTLPAAHVGRMQSVVNAGTGPGLVAAGVLALTLLPDWRLSWALAAATAAAAGALVLVSSARRRPADQNPDAASITGSLPPAGWFRQHLRVITSALLLGAGSAAVWTFGRTALVEAGASQEVSALAWVALGVGGAAVIVTAGSLQKLSPRRAWLLTCLPVAGATVLLGFFAGAWPIAFAACIGFGWGYTAGTGVLIAWTTRLDAARAPAGTALLFVVLVLGQAIGSATVGGVIEQLGTPLSFTASAALVLVGALGASMRRPSDSGPEAQGAHTLEVRSTAVADEAARRPRTARQRA
ncbi:MAG: MFS transporter [Pseudoclavibacter sp.]